MKWATTSLILVVVFLSAWVAAEEPDTDRFIINGGFGEPGVKNSGYDVGSSLSAFFDVAVAFKGPFINYRVGYVKIPELEREGNFRVTLNSNGVYLGVGKLFEHKRVAFEIGGGAFISETDADFYGRDVASENDISPFVNATAIVRLTSLFALEADWKYIDDVSGGNYSLPRLGVRFTF